DGKPDQAIAMLAPLLEKSQHDLELITLAGEAHMRARQFREAAGFFESATALAPQAPSLRTSLALSRLGQGDSAGAINALEQAARALERQQPGQPLPHNLQGGVSLAQQDYRAARASFDKALSLEPAYLPAIENLTQLDLIEKHPEAARQRLEAALARDKKNAN